LGSIERKEMNAMCSIGKIHYATVVVLVGLIGCHKLYTWSGCLRKV